MLNVKISFNTLQIYALFSKTGSGKSANFVNVYFLYVQQSLAVDII